MNYKSAILGILWSALSLLPAQAEESPAAHILKGYEHESQKQFREAVEAYSRALAVEEDSPVALVRRAYCRTQIGAFREAAEDLKAASISVPVSISDYQTLAWLKATAPFEVVRDGVLAVTYAGKAHKETPSAASYDALAAAYAKMGIFQKARNLIMEGLKKFPDSDRAAAMRQRLELYNQNKPYHESWLQEENREFERSLR